MRLKIDKEFKNLIPPLCREEFEQLEQNIIAEGRCRDKLKVWRGILVDGYHRHEICIKHGIPFEVDELHFASRRDAVIWIIEHQLGRRNLTNAMRIELVSRRGKLPKKEIAAQAGVSGYTVYKYMKICEANNPHLLESVKKAKQKLMPHTRP